MQTRLCLDNSQKKRAIKMGITDVQKKYNIEDMIKGDVMFCASGVTNGSLVKGIKDIGKTYEASTFALHKKSNTIKKITNTHNK